MAKDEQKEAQRALYEKQAKAEIRRIKRFVREAEKRGYVFSDNVIPNLPKKENFSAGTVRKYKAITPEKLYKKATKILPGTKRRVSGTTARKVERSEAAKKAAKTRAINRAMKVLKEVRRIIAEWTPNPVWSDDLAFQKEKDKNTLSSILDGAIAEFGEVEVAKRMEKRHAEVIELTYAIIYGQSKDKRGGREGVNMNLATFSAIIRDKPLSIQESMEFTEFGEQDESQEYPV